MMSLASHAINRLRELYGHVLTTMRERNARQFAYRHCGAEALRPQIETLEPRLLLSAYPGIPDDILDGYSIPDGQGGTVQEVATLIETYAPVLRLSTEELYRPEDVGIFAAATLRCAVGLHSQVSRRKDSDFKDGARR